MASSPLPGGPVRSRIILTSLVIVALGACTSDVPTAPSDLRPLHHEVPPAPGAAGPDLYSKNMKLLVNLAKTGDAAQTDVAFAGPLVFAGNYEGFRVVDASDPENPTVVSTVACNGAQGDVSVYGRLLFLSVDAPQSSSACDSYDVSVQEPGMFEGVRIFDISNPANPQHVASVATACGSHTNTLVPDPANGRVLVYVSSVSRFVGVNTTPTCRAPHGFISIVNVPLANPAAATVSRYTLDGATEFWGGTRGCHDITVFLEIQRAAAACYSENQMWDIADPLNPVLLWRFDNAAGSIWHSAAFSWDGQIVAFGDEAGGGSEARCADPNDEQGRIWFVDVASGALRGSYKLPRAETGECTAHNFNFVPLKGGRKVLVSAWYTGGTSVVDVDKLLAGAPSAVAELGFYRPQGGDVWSSYWYNGFIYANDMNRGLDVMLLSDNARAGARKFEYMNPQTQEQLIR